MAIEAKRRRDPINTGIARAQINDSDLLPAVPPNPDLQRAFALLEAGHDKNELSDLMSLPSAQFDVMMAELDEQSLEQCEDVEEEKLRRGIIVYHPSTHVSNAPSLRSAQAQRQGREQEEIRNSGIRIFRPSDEDGD